MKVVRITLPYLRNEEWFKLQTDFRETVNKYGAENLNIGELFNRSSSVYYRADELLEVLNKSTYTQKLVKDDRERDELIRGLFNSTKSSLKQPNEAKKNAAERLNILFQKYRKPTLSGTYLEESSAIYNLLQDLDGPYAAEVALLGLNDWVEAIREAQQRFLDSHSQRTQENVAKPKMELRPVRSELNALYQGMIGTCEIRLLADGLGGKVVVDPKELDNGTPEENEDKPPHMRGNVNYNFVIEWNEIVKKYRNLLANRAGRRNKNYNSDTPEPENPQEEEEI
ncbi:MAG: DUF6261 family protein [Tannerellaceae bacterium]|jgi:hypothetical protein|nr:DUF6261 family protein [Tannerellaceae bacterium]